MLEDNTTCRTLCMQDIPAEDAKFINERIKEDYALNWLVDGLPAAEMKVDTKTGDIFYDMGFNLGDDEGEFAEHPALNNHYEIVFKRVSNRMFDSILQLTCATLGITHPHQTSSESSVYLFGPLGSSFTYSVMLSF